MGNEDQHPLLPSGLPSIPTIAKSHPSRTRFLLCFGILTICVLVFSRPSVETLPGSDWVPHLTLKRPSTDSIVVDQVGRHTATIIFLHGLGGSPELCLELVNEVRPRLHQVQWQLLSSGSIPVTANMGQPMPAWFDMHSLQSPGDDQLPDDDDEPRLQVNVDRVQAIIDAHVARGIEANRIVVAGFSQGCAIALLAGLASEKPLGGIVCLSGWLPIADHNRVFNGTRMHDMQTDHAASTDVFWGHGDSDPTVPHGWGEKSANMLRKFGFNHVDFHTYPGLAHWVNGDELRDMGDWLVKRLAAI